jgi:hypothetical protein
VLRDQHVDIGSGATPAFRTAGKICASSIFFSW